MTVVEPPRCVTPMANLAMIQQSASSSTDAHRGARHLRPRVLGRPSCSRRRGRSAAASSRRPRAFDKFLKKVSTSPSATTTTRRARSTARCRRCTTSPSTLTRSAVAVVAEVAPYVPRPTASSSIMVPTLDTVRSTWLLDSIVQVKGTVLFVGESSTAKTTAPSTSARATPTRTRPRHQLLVAHLVDGRADRHRTRSKRQGHLRPARQQAALVFVDDLNMPRVDTYAQQPIALSLVIDKGFLYDRGKDLTIKYIKDMQFVAAMVPGSVDPRFVGSLAFCITFEESIKRIWTILQAFFDEGTFPSTCRARLRASAPAAMGIFNAIVAAMPPTPAKFLHLQPARPVAHHRGRDAGDARQVRRHGRSCGSACGSCASSLTALVGDKTFVQDTIEATFKATFAGEADGAATRSSSATSSLQRDRGAERRAATATWCASTRTWPTTARSSPSSTRCSPRTTWRTR